MKMTRLTLSLLALLALAHTPAFSAEAPRALKEMSQGKANAPITVIEYASFTCSHCADFANTVLPQIEKDYIETGKVKLIFKEYATDAISLKASALARCLPDTQYLPFVKILFKNYPNWLKSPKPEDTLVQYATMSGLTPEKARGCMDDTQSMDALVEQRNEAMNKFDIKGTPAFVINNGEEKLIGALSYEEYKKVFDKILATKK